MCFVLQTCVHHRDAVQCWWSASVGVSAELTFFSRINVPAHHIWSSESLFHWKSSNCKEKSTNEVPCAWSSKTTPQHGAPTAMFHCEDSTFFFPLPWPSKGSVHVYCQDQRTDFWDSHGPDVHGSGSDVPLTSDMTNGALLRDFTTILHEKDDQESTLTQKNHLNQENEVG